MPNTSNRHDPNGPSDLEFDEPQPRPHPASTLAAPLKIAVLMGGANTERFGSLSTGTAIARALRWVGHAVASVDSAQAPLTVDRDPDHAYTTAEVEEADIPDAPVGPTVATPPDLRALAAIRAQQEEGVLAPGVLEVLQAADVVFVTVFGDEGELGRTQRVLERHGIIYTGPTPDVCELTFDKARSKAAVAAQGIDTAAWHVVRRDHIEADLAELTIPGPWIVKPRSGGSTIGLTKVEDPADLPAACELASRENPDALIEEFVAGRDLTVAAIGDRVFAVVESVSEGDVFSYEAKYTPGGSRKECPADLTDTDTARVRRIAGEVNHALGLEEATSRVDFRLAPDGRLVFLETNPLPGMTTRSSFPLAAAAHGLSFSEVCEAIAVQALRRAGRSVTEPQG